jgi:glucose-6-phosphate 1-dehydrogenase
VIQNHLLQVLATVLAEPPDGTGLDSWRASKSQLVGALRPLTPELTVRGQYQGYRDVKGVAPDSGTETYAAIRLAADSWRWADVPILVRAGKCLPVTATEVTITFRRPPHDAFQLSDQGNTLRFRINPENRVSLSLVGKKPGAGWLPETEELRFAEHPGSDMRPYDRLIGAALNGERWLFASQDTVEAAWRVVDPCSATWSRSRITPAAAGARTRPPVCCRTARTGTTRRTKAREKKGEPVTAGSPGRRAGRCRRSSGPGRSGAG